MYKYLLFIIFIVLSFFACKEKRKGLAISSSSDTSAYFPVNNFIKEDINDVLQNPYHLYKITDDKPGSRDSASISTEEFVQLAGSFLSKDITTPALKPLFQESVFHDLSTKSITINYTAIDPLSDIQNISVLLHDKTNKLNRVFIRSSYTKGDSVFLEQDNWKAGKSFRIIKSVIVKNAIQSETETTVIWNDKPYQ